MNVATWTQMGTYTRPDAKTSSLLGPVHDRGDLEIE